MRYPEFEFSVARPFKFMLLKVNKKNNHIISNFKKCYTPSVPLK